MTMSFRCSGYESVRRALLQPQSVASRSEVLSRPSCVPKEPGVYAWYFRQIPPGVPTKGCHGFRDLTLLYIGISPGYPPRNNKPASRQSMRSRVRYHFRGNAEGSTLRRTLGCLLQGALGIELRRVGSGERMTFAAGEELLSGWLAENAFVAWATHPEPWEVERVLIASLDLPFNIDQNARHVFCNDLSALRCAARVRARELPVLGRATLSSSPTGFRYIV